MNIRIRKVSVDIIFTETNRTKRYSYDDQQFKKITNTLDISDDSSKGNQLVRINEEKEEVSYIDQGEEVEDDEDEDDDSIDQSCDFSEANMLENTLALPLNLLKSHSKKLMNKVLDKKRSKSIYNTKKLSKKKSKMEFPKDNMILEENEDTIIEYDLMLPSSVMFGEGMRKKSNSLRNTNKPQKEEEINFIKASEDLKNLRHPLTDPDNQNTNFTTINNAAHTAPEVGHMSEASAQCKKMGSSQSDKDKCYLY